MSKHLASFLADHDTPCPACGYNLRGLQHPNCPECSEPLALRVTLAEPDLAVFLGALVGLALGVGFSGLLCIYFIIEAFTGHMSRREWLEFGLACLLPFIVEGSAMLLLIAKRGRFQRLAAPAQRWVIAGAWGLTVGAFITFRLMVR